MAKRVLTDDQIKTGIQKLEKWFGELPDYEKDQFVVVGGGDCWTARQVVEEMRKRVENNDLGHDDFPEKCFAELITS